MRRAGCGKSQLLHALAATWSRHHSPDSVLLLTATDFARNYAAAVKLDEVPRFQQRYQRIDFLLIDDLDQLQPKPGAATAIGDDHRTPPALPASDGVHGPTTLATRWALSSRLTSRLASGLVIPLQLPSAVTRQAILQRLCQQRQLGLTSSAEQLLSESETITVPQLMGLLNQLRQQTPIAAGADEVAIDVSDVQQLLSTATVDRVETTDIIRTTARYFGLHPRNLSGSSRRKMDVLARSCAMFMIREMTGASFQQIGQHFGGRDHTTVIHACKKVAAHQDTDMTMRNALQEIQRRLNDVSTNRNGRL